MRQNTAVIIAVAPNLTCRHCTEDKNHYQITSGEKCGLEPDVPLQEAFEKARRDILIDVIRDLNDKNLVILKAAMSRCDGYVKDVYKEYCRISHQYKEEPFSYMHFYSSLSYLQSLGLIALVSTKINRAYTNRIQFTFDAAILETIWKIRFE